MKIDALNTSDILTHQTHAFLFAGSFQKAINDNVKDKPCSLIKGELKANMAYLPGTSHSIGLNPDTMHMVAFFSPRPMDGVPLSQQTTPA